MKKFSLLLFLLVITSALLFISCTEEDGEELVKVMVSYGDGVSVLSENPVTVKKGDNAEFDISFGKTYALESLSHGTLKGGKLVVEGVERNTTVNLIATDLGYDTTVKYKFNLRSEQEDTSSIGSGNIVNAGTAVKVCANEKFKIFVGWSVGKETTNPEEMISTDREFEFRLSPSMLTMPSYAVIDLYGNYIEASALRYHPNGGSINGSSPNMTYDDYYKAYSDGESISVIMSQGYSGICESVNLFYDDGTFEREGYVLVEYNTKPDGTGDSYSLGSMFYYDTADSGSADVYCIWKKSSDEDNFKYGKRTYSCPFDISKEPGWKEKGVYITKYTGSEETVVIPEKIGNQHVIGVAAGAFENCSLKTLVFSKYIRDVEDGAFSGCSSLETVYYSDAIYRISDKAFDAATYSNLHNFYVNATMAPRYSNSNGGIFSVKLSRILASMDKNRIIIIAGSSAHLGVSSTYLEALVSEEYRVVNFGTTRTINCTMFLEAMGELTHEGDIVIYAPENSSYMMGEGQLYWKTLRDLESMYNIFRHIDIGNYSRVLTAFSEFNTKYRLKAGGGIKPSPYEERMKVISNTSSDKYGDSRNPKKTELSDKYYSYWVTFSEMFKSRDEGDILDGDEGGDVAYKDPSHENYHTWADITDEYFTTLMNIAIRGAKKSGAKVCFAYCPVDEIALVEEARNEEWLSDYEKMIEDTYEFDLLLGSAIESVYNHNYFYDSAFHLNDVGRTFHTYRIYRDLCRAFGWSEKAFREAGDSFGGCIFELGSTGTPTLEVEYFTGGGEG